ncbi:MAG: PAS domain-containing protein [Sphingomonadales bacterium]|nr:PAS domain-containing protein [Sphingomonadales bacterium]PIX67553.1 MAG: histidine kinase [Sphingomonadales bacterium CG_4_10_14_3_um_filter_58_15]NCO49378.1 PAS domain-containing protein [Sphingomonadales bacterium]NCP00099.1 PAS domain-containing protein [Sphingomonadales bacterium]NCP27243.1 PAS domain-containing protein [Sphingomonadales bacterium]
MQTINEAHFDNFLGSIQFNPIATVISDPNLRDNPIVAVNDAFCVLTQYPPEEVVGRNCKFLAGDETEPWLTDKIRDGVRRHSPVLVEILNYKRDGTKFRNAVLVAPIFDDGDILRYFLGTQVELPEENWDLFPNRKRHARALVGDLSNRQRQVLQKITQGRRTKQIAHELSLSEKTIEMHRALLFRKLNAINVADAVRIGIDAGL